jgi:hypothetical protein
MREGAGLIRCPLTEILTTLPSLFSRPGLEERSSPAHKMKGPKDSNRLKEKHRCRPILLLLLGESLRFGSYKSMKPKDALLGAYRDLAENNALQKDGVFLEVLIDIRDVLAAIESRLRPMQDGPAIGTG